MKKRNILIAAIMVGVYITLPAYRYYAIGSYIGYKILADKQNGYKVVARKQKKLIKA
jgi:hypothetical protein